ncbi:MAG: helix-turn-helix domain-containing protein [Pseudomonadota bacterium]
MDFASVLASQRRARRLSQAQLASLSGVAQRHISFLETRRSQPGPQSVEKLARALELDFADINALYSSAGLAPPRRELDWASEQFAPARSIVRRMLTRHDPYPGLAMTVSGDILLANDGLKHLITWLYTDKKQFSIDNLYDLTFHRDSLLQFMLNPDEVVPHTLKRLIQAAQTSNEAANTLARVRSYPAVQESQALASDKPLSAGSMIIERYKAHGTHLAFTSMAASFGSPEDVTAQFLRILLLFPSDKETERVLESGLEVAGSPERLA